MATRDWMRGEASLIDLSERAGGERRPRAHDRPNGLEVSLAVFAVAAWLWCAFEVMGAVIH
ncbi:MAG TPA: hypothetical protein VII63_10930 [Caulobacteraceae bacterium]